MLSTQLGAAGCEGWLAQARDELSELAVGIALQALAISDLTERQDKFDVIEPLLEPALLSATLLEQLLKENPLDEILLDWLMNIVVPGSSSLEPEQLSQIMSHLMQVESLVDAGVAVARTISVLFVYHNCNERALTVSDKLKQGDPLFVEKLGAGKIPPAALCCMLWASDTNSCTLLHAFRLLCS